MLRAKILGDDTLRIAVKDRRQRATIAQHLRSTSSWLECVEGMREVVVQFDAAIMTPREAKKQLRQQLTQAKAATPEPARSIEIPVCYGGEFGPELASIAEMLRMHQDDVIKLHTSRDHRVELIGFTPGFAYVSGLSDDVDVPRLSEPRQRVEPGSVGVAGGLTGLYALAGPGGWPLIGRTPLALFQTHASQPMLLQGGMRVRFVAISLPEFHERMSA